tara:strand:+ start:4874 stop:6886 length:2013 start_codon:yes stop_codon:yes gene_type:complete
MAYSVTTNNGDVITVNDEAKDSSSLSLTVIGRNATNYGQSIFTNTVRQLENFAGNTPPSATYLPTGQLWYDKGENTLRVYNGATWARTSLVPTNATDITEEVVTGTQYFNTTEDKLRVYDGAVFRDAVLPGGTVTSALTGSTSGSATNYGAKTETLFLTSQGGSPSVVPVVAIKYVSDGSTPGELADTQHDSAGATVMAIFSDTAFTIAASDPYYATLSNVNSFSGTITKGMNLRADYTDSSIAQADTSAFADKANAFNVGGTIVPAADYIHVGSTNWVPSGTVSTNYTLGNATNRFGTVHTDTLQIGNAGTPQTVGVIGTVNIGNATNQINSLFVNDLTVSGDLDFTNVNTLTNLESADIDAVTLTSGTISTTATAATDIVNYQTLQNATTSTALVSGKVIVTAPASPAVSHSVFLGQGTSGNLDTRAHASLSYIPSTGTLSTTAVSATTFTGDLTGDVTGAIAGTTANMSGTVTGDTLTDGTVSINNGAITGAQGITSLATITGSVVTDGTAQITSGAITGATNITATGTVTANLFSGVATAARYADLAEKYTTDADYEAGTVVKIGGDAEITMTTEHADTEVFGVISTAPAYLMNKDIDGLPVALQGRVPVKVIGKVSKGQRLTSSDVPGLAWAVDENTPIQAIIGRSLENKTDGDQGVVEAVIGIK